MATLVFDDNQQHVSDNGRSLEFDQPSTPTGLPNINQPTTATPAPTGGINLPPMMQKAAQAIETPVRGFQGIGVGIEKLLAGINPIKFSGMPGTQLDIGDIQKIAANANDALQSAAAAMKPGYVPQQGEKLGAFLGGAGATAALTGPLMAAAGPALAGAVGAEAPLALAATQGGVDAATAGGLTALQEASDKGIINPHSVGLNAAIAGAIPFAKPAYEAIVGAAKNLLPEILEKTANMPSTGVKRAIENPDLISPTTQADAEKLVEQRVSEIQKKLVDIRAAAGKANNAVKVDLGLEVPEDQKIADLAKNGTPPSLEPQDIAQAYQDRGQVPESQRLKYLYDLKKQINNLVEFRPGVVKDISSSEEGLLKNLASKVDKEMTSLPGGDRLKESNQAFSKIADVYDDLQKKIQDPGQAEDTLAKLFRGDINIVTRGRSKDVKAALSKLDDMAGEPVTEKLWDSMTNQMFNKWTGRGIGSYFVGQTGVGQAMQDLFQGKVATATGKLAASVPLVSPRIAGMGIRAGATVSPYVDRFLSTISDPKLQSAIVSAIATPKGESK